MKPIPDFKTELERYQWFIDNADYFTAITRRERKNFRYEYTSLADADAGAREHMRLNVNIRSFMIYAVVNNSDSFVKSILRKQHGPAHQAQHNVRRSARTASGN